MSNISVQTPSATTAATRDLYPSRVADKPQIMPRQDPVLYGSANEGPLDEQALALYEENGFLQFDALLQSAELESVIQELNRLRQDETLKSTAQCVIEPESRETRSIFAVHEISEIMRRLCANPKIAAIAEQLLGSDVYVHQSRINYKQGFHGEPFYWHSDFETWHVEDGMPSMRAVSCSIALTPNLPQNGPLMLIPSSHHHFVSCVGETPEDHYKQSLRRQELGVPDEESLTQLAQNGGVVSPTGPVGSVTFFECNTMHGSNSNITPYPRSNFFVVYNSMENPLVDPFCGLPPRPNHISERERVIKVRDL